MLSTTSFRISVISCPRNPPHVGNGHWFEPELRVSSGVSDVDVRRLPPLHAEEEEPIPTDSQQSGHITSLPPPDSERSSQAADESAYRSFLRSLASFSADLDRGVAHRLNASNFSQTQKGPRRQARGLTLLEVKLD